MIGHNKVFRNTSLCLLILVPLVGCVSVGPDYSAPDNQQFEESVYSQRYKDYENGEIDHQWQQAFLDPTLAQLVELTKSQNRDVQTAVANLEAAAARLNVARAERLPQGQVDASVMRQQIEGNTTDGALIEQDLYSVGASAQWLVSVFGRNQKRIERALAELGGLEALAYDVQRLQVAQTIATYLTLRELQTRERIVQRNISTLERSLKLTEEGARIGSRAEFDVLRQQTLLAQTQAARESLQARLPDVVAALAIATGQTTTQLESLLAQTTPPNAQYMREILTQTLTLDSAQAVLSRRPDVRIAERQLAASTATVGLVTAELFPKLSLTGSVSSTSNTSSGLFDGDPGYSFGPTLSWGIFSYPAILAEIEASEAAVKAARAEYEKTVLSALNNTDAILTVYARSLDQVRSLDAARASSKRSLFLAQERYRVGSDSLLVLLDAQRTAFQIEDEFVAAQYAAARNRIDVHVALGS